VVFRGFISAEHEKSVMLNYPKLWRQWIKQFGHHRDFNGNLITTNKRRVGGHIRSANRRTLKYGRKKK